MPPESFPASPPDDCEGEDELLQAAAIESGRTSATRRKERLILAT
jgi:hypothetical protein